jgi:radical SAM superfamily enzyme YgiQ (UPF0313 family)
MESSREMQTILHYWNGLGAALPTIAGLTPKPHEVAIIDENVSEIDFDVEVDIVGLTAMTQQAPRAYEIARAFRERGVHVALGGIHATVLPDEAVRHVDAVFVGEAENTWPRFIEDFLTGATKRVYSQSDYPPVDMTTIPMPRYDLLAETKYPVVWVQATRGCPHDCDFCAATKVYGSVYRHKNAEQVAAEVREVKKYFRAAQVGFADDNMFVNKRFTRELLGEFESIPFTWYAQSDVAIADDPFLLRQLHDVGLRIVFVGLESVSQQNLSAINRNQWKARRVERYPQSIEAIQGAGIGVYGSFIVGLDGDDASVFRDTSDFINTHHIMGTQATILTPFPGSELRDRLADEGRITSSDWSLYTAWNCVIDHPRLSAEELEQGLLSIYRDVYNEDAFRDRASHFKAIFTRMAAE